MGVFFRNNSWYIRYRLPGGKKKWEKVGPSRRKAELLLAQRKVSLSSGVPLTPKKIITLHALLDRYYEHAKTTNAASNQRNLLWMLNKLKTLENCRANEISLDKLHKWVYNGINGGLQPSTLRNLWHQLGRAYSLASKEWGLLPTNPLKDAKFPLKVANERTRFLLPEEIPAVLAGLPPPWQGMATVAVYTGLRKSEVYNLKWADVDLKRGYLQVHHGKGDKFRMVPIAAPLATYLASLPRVSEYVFTSTKSGSKFRTTNMPGWKTALERMGIVDFHFHDLRHTTATLLRMSGVDLQTIGEILGHSNLRFTQRYAHLPQAARKGAMEKLAGLITAREDQLPT